MTAAVAPLAVLLLAAAQVVAGAAEATDLQGASRATAPNDTQTAAADSALCWRLKGVKKACSADGCTVIALQMVGRSCTTFCGSVGLQCYRASEVGSEGCMEPSTGSCETTWANRSEAVCECSGASGSSPAYRFAGSEITDLGFLIAGPQDSKYAKGWLQVTSVTPGSWADQVGLQTGSAILDINGFILTPFNVERLLATRPVRLHVD